MASWDIHTTGIVEWLEEYEGPRFHAILADPPYALISIAKRFGPGQAPAQEGEDGRYQRLSKGFMGQTWDGFDSLESYQDWIGIWSKLLIEKALYPGAVALFFGGTRTFHHLGVGLERGGFEIVDSVLIPWLHGQGFPKSHDISKGLDKRPHIETYRQFAIEIREARKKAGLSRQDVSAAVVGSRSGACWNWENHLRLPEYKHWEKLKNILPDLSNEWGELLQEAEREVVGKDRSGKTAIWNREEKMGEYDITIPATSDAEIWDGYGTALKPAWEPVFVCRAPRGDMTFAELAVEYGTGALAIDRSRIGHNEPEEIMQPRSPDFRGAVYNNAKVGKERDGSDALASPNPAGRWPANLLLTHHEACVKVGEYETKGRVINRWKDGMLPFGGGAGQEYETIDPTREGEASAGRTYEHEGGTDFAMKPGARRGMETVDLYACVPGCPVRELDDQVGDRPGPGGFNNPDLPSTGMWAKDKRSISQYPGQTGGPSRFFYTAKASRSEKDKGLENFYWKRTKEDGWERISEEEWAKTDRALRGRGNIHPTCKPLALLHYLATLILPPSREEDRCLLVPFSGSGSEMIAAMQAGWDQVTGVEMAEIYVEMAEARIRGAIGML